MSARPFCMHCGSLSWVTAPGTVLGLLLTSTMGYVLSRPGFRLKGFFTYIVFIPMIFNGGMLANLCGNE